MLYSRITKFLLHTQVNHALLLRSEHGLGKNASAKVIAFSDQVKVIKQTDVDSNSYNMVALMVFEYELQR